MFPTVALAAALALPTPPALGTDQTIVEAALGNDQLTTLVTALQAADLVETLQGPGPFTVFAPVNDAFDKIPADKLNRLLQNKPALKDVLTFHVSGANLLAADVVAASGVVSLQGQKIDFTPQAGSVVIDGAGLVQTDIVCSNGVIHLIDTVITPAQANLVETAVSTGLFDTLVAAATAAGLADVLAGDTELTVFAPSDRAFAKLPAGTIDMLLDPANLDMLIAVLENHIVAGRVYSEDVVMASSLTPLGGGRLPVTVDRTGVQIDGVAVLAVDIDASNGVVHVVDEVLVPSR